MIAFFVPRISYARKTTPRSSSSSKIAGRRQRTKSAYRNWESAAGTSDVLGGSSKLYGDDQAADDPDIRRPDFFDAEKVFEIHLLGRHIQNCRHKDCQYLHGDIQDINIRFVIGKKGTDH